MVARSADRDCILPDFQGGLCPQQAGEGAFLIADEIILAPAAVFALGDKGDIVGHKALGLLKAVNRYDNVFIHKRIAPLFKTESLRRTSYNSINIKNCKIKAEKLTKNMKAVKKGELTVLFAKKQFI
jgi:hypothetical protein